MAIFLATWLVHWQFYVFFFFFHLSIPRSFYPTCVNCIPLHLFNMVSSFICCEALLEDQLYPESPRPSLSSFPGKVPPKCHQILQVCENSNYKVVHTQLILPLIAQVNQIQSDQLLSDLNNLPITIPGDQASINSIIDILLETDLNNLSQALIRSKRI